MRLFYTLNARCPLLVSPRLHHCATQAGSHAESHVLAASASKGFYYFFTTGVLGGEKLDFPRKYWSE